MKTLMIIVLAAIIFQAQVSEAFTTTTKMQVETVTLGKGEYKGQYKHTLLTLDDKGNYVVYSNNKYEAGDWVIIYVELFAEKDGSLTANSSGITGKIGSSEK